MLHAKPSAFENFSRAPRSGEFLSRDGERAASPGKPIARGGVEKAGDEVVFDRLDLAEALGIWRHARGRVVGIERLDGRVSTIDVKFDGHEVLSHYLPDLFRTIH